MVQAKLVHKCNNCYWGQERKQPPYHFGCYFDSKWRKWVPKKNVDIPNSCPDWKEANSG